MTGPGSQNLLSGIAGIQTQAVLLRACIRNYQQYCHDTSWYLNDEPEILRQNDK